MTTPWSITTTTRNPYRTRDFLKVLKTLEGVEWNLETQIEYQTRLIQERCYGYGISQFYSGLPSNLVQLVDDASRPIPYRVAEEIFQLKNYKDPPMRGRQSANSLKKFGFAIISDGRVHITRLGNQFLEEDHNMQDIFLRVFLKWQIPNPDNKSTFNTEAYNIKPFVGILCLISQVNELEKSYGKEPKGISRDEFCLFAPTLIHHCDIESQTNQIDHLRNMMAGRTKQVQRELWESQKRFYAKSFLQTDDENEITKLLSNLSDYGDNAIRYFRLTSYIHIRGNGYYIDLEPRRSVEINALLETDNAAAEDFKTKSDFYEYISNPSLPVLPWGTPDRQISIIHQIEHEIQHYETKLDLPQSSLIDPSRLNETERKDRIAQLNVRRRELQDIDRYRTAQEVGSIQECIDVLDGIYDYEQRPILLEKTATLCLCAINDAIGISPQYPVGDDNEPVFTAPGNVPDIECFYNSFNSVCEVTMLTSRDQWYHEGQPVMRHLRDFEDRHPDRPAYCLFIAPSIHRDTLNTFWLSVKHGYEGRSLCIVPLTINQLSQIMKKLHELRLAGVFLSHLQLQQLLDNVIQLCRSTDNSTEWIESIPEAIQSWEGDLLP